MDSFLTAHEISVRWNVALGTIQNLCRNGKLEGAVKRAGIWFVPADAPNPLKNNKSGGNDFNFIGTKKRVFDSAIELFASHGYENVSLRDIGDAVDLTQSTIYNHFSSKHKILDTIYDYYIENFNNRRIPVEEMKNILRAGTKEEFCAALMFTFGSENEEEQIRMYLITKIIYMRFYQDDRARDIFLNLMNAETEEYDKEILEYGVSIGVIKPFDIDIYVKFLVGQRHIMGMKAFAAVDYKPGELDEEKRIMKMSADMIPFVSGETNGL